VYFGFGSSSAVQKSEKTLNAPPIFARFRETVRERSMKAMSQFCSSDPQRRPNYVKAMEAHLLVILWAASAMADREAKEWIAAHDEAISRFTGNPPVLWGFLQTIVYGGEMHRL
jgi:hypothetical protein